MNHRYSLSYSKIIKLILRSDWDCGKAEVLKYLDDYRDILKSVPLKCKLYIISLLFNTIDENINNIETIPSPTKVLVKQTQSRIQVFIFYIIVFFNIF